VTLGVVCGLVEGFVPHVVPSLESLRTKAYTDLL
jgi:hypothetical protein